MKTGHITSVIRLIFYTAFVLTLFHFQKSDNAVLSGAIAGFIVGDVFTWVLCVLMDLPRYLSEGKWELVITALAGFVVLRFFGIAVPQSGEAMAIAFLVSILVAAVKGSYYSLELLMDGLSD